jgi:hypothetical protein
MLTRPKTGYVNLNSVVALAVRERGVHSMYLRKILILRQLPYYWDTIRNEFRSNASPNNDAIGQGVARGNSVIKRLQTRIIQQTHGFSKFDFCLSEVLVTSDDDRCEKTDDQNFFHIGRYKVHHKGVYHQRKGCLTLMAN